ncbi:MAG: TRAP transporter small permease, partial [Dehalococcoidia bacterium]|nr:TRAP transporter small permease [Dehalococcoidia bacterium]
ASRAARITERINAVAGFATGVIIFAMFVAVIYSVFLRYVLEAPTRWVVDVGEMMLLPLVYLPLAYIQQRGGHVAIDLVANRFHGRSRASLNIAVCLLGMFFAFLIVWQGGLTWWDFYHRGKLSMIALLPEHPAAFFIPLGGVLFGLQFLIQLGRNMAAFKIGEEGGFVTPGEEGGLISEA